jgi:squalene-hopene/tetraprenyl-beta-curcumene cyclase
MWFSFVKFLSVTLLFVGSSFLAIKAAEVEQPGKAAAGATADYRQMVDRSVEYLRVRGQSADGSFSGHVGVGPTGLVVSALLEVGLDPEDPMVKRSLSFLLDHVQSDGGIYAKESRHRNYDTCIAMVAFHRANQDGRYDAIVKKAEAFVRGIQWDDSEGLDKSAMEYGGAGYGSRSRPDLSNTSFLIESLRAIGNGPEDEAIQKALIFVSRCQNLESPFNDSKHAAKVNDGGFYYTVAGEGESKAEPLPNGGLRSYGSMSYAGFKSLIYAGLDRDDPRVQAVVDYLSKNYDLEMNPGLGLQGLFYYYQAMAKALSAFGEDVFTDAAGTSHDWKVQLRQKLVELQNEDGSWVNENTRWMEGDPNLVSAYALLALANCRP